MTEQQLLSALTQAAEASGLPAALQHYYGDNIRLSLPLPNAHVRRLSTS